MGQDLRPIRRAFHNELMAAFPKTQCARMATLQDSRILATQFSDQKALPLISGTSSKAQSRQSCKEHIRGTGLN